MLIKSNTLTVNFVVTLTEAVIVKTLYHEDCLCIVCDNCYRCRLLAQALAALTT